MRRIRILQIPPGFAPMSIRRNWVDIEIRLPLEAELDNDSPSNVGIGNDNSGGYTVLRSDAIQALRSAQRNAAADYWDSLPLGAYLVFRRDVCEMLE